MMDRVETLNPNTGRPGPRIDRGKYEALREAILTVVGGGADGILFKDLLEAVEPHVPAYLFADGGSLSWHTTCVKLDLEARGLIERVPGAKPQRLKLPK